MHLSLPLYDRETNAAQLCRQPAYICCVFSRSARVPSRCACESLPTHSHLFYPTSFLPQLIFLPAVGGRVDESYETVSVDCIYMYMAMGRLRPKEGLISMKDLQVTTRVPPEAACDSRRAHTHISSRLSQALLHVLAARRVFVPKRNRPYRGAQSVSRGSLRLTQTNRIVGHRELLMLVFLPVFHLGPRKCRMPCTQKCSRPQIQPLSYLVKTT